MKRYLATTAVVTLLAGSAVAGDLAAKIGGNIDFEMGRVSQKQEYKKNSTPNQKSFKIRNRSHIFVSAEGAAENGTTYGANAKINGTSEQKKGISTGKVDKTYLWIESTAGRVELGSNFEVGKLMAVGAESIAAATGGASDGNWSDYVNFEKASPSPLTAMGSTFYNGDSLSTNGRSSTETDRKVSWMSPRYSDFQVGVSYSPDMANNGDGVATTGLYTQVKNAFSFAVNYTGVRNDMNVAASLTHDMGKVTTANTKDLAASKVGLAIGKNGITVAGSYGTDGKSYMTKGTQGYTSKFYTAGVAYEDGPMTSSLTYLNRKTNSDLSKAKLTSYALGLDYKLAAGLKTFAEVTAFKAKDKAQTTKNKGTVVIIGSKVSF
jgi:hypothetical protein